MNAVNQVTYACVKWILDITNRTERSPFYGEMRVRAVQALCGVFVGDSTMLQFIDEQGLLSVLLNPRGVGDTLAINIRVCETLLKGLIHVLKVEQVLLIYT
jgi:hypothetical protein